MYVTITRIPTSGVAFSRPLRKIRVPYARKHRRSTDLYSHFPPRNSKTRESAEFTRRAMRLMLFIPQKLAGLIRRLLYNANETASLLRILCAACANAPGNFSKTECTGVLLWYYIWTSVCFSPFFLCCNMKYPVFTSHELCWFTFIFIPIFAWVTLSIYLYLAVKKHNVHITRNISYPTVTKDFQHIEQIACILIINR